MKFVGIDLAGNPKNDTGFCILEIAGESKTVATSLLHTDTGIIEKIHQVNPELVAIDAPLTYSGMNRRCDEELRGYGALPVTLRGMDVLARRGTCLAEKLRAENIKVIEVYATASAKILGFYEKDENAMQKHLMDANLEGDIQRRMLKKDELDAVSSALTAYLHYSGASEEVGDAAGKIIVPKV